MKYEYRNFWSYFISGAISWIFAMVFIAAVLQWELDWLKWFLITTSMVIVPNGMLAFVASGETREQREHRERNELDQRVADRLKAKGIN